MNACLRKLINEYEEIVTSISYLPAISCTELIHIIAYEQKKKGITFQTVAKEYMDFMKGEEREKSYKLYKIAFASDCKVNTISFSPFLLLRVL